MDKKRSDILDLEFRNSCSNTNSIVNWLNQTTNIKLSTSDYSPSSDLSSLADHSLSSPNSIISSNADEESFNYLYLLASAAVERLTNNSEQVSNNLELAIKT